MASSLRPNYFIGYRLNAVSFQAQICNLHEAIKESAPHLASTFTSAKKLHLTGFVMNLNDDTVPAAIASFNSIKEELTLELAQQRPFLQFDRLNTFTCRVLFAQPHENETVGLISNLNFRILHCFLQSEVLRDASTGLTSVSLHDWKPHVTIAKLRPHHKKIKIRLEELGDLHGHVRGAEVPLLSIDLLSMAEADATGYYRSLASIPLMSEYNYTADERSDKYLIN